MLSNKALIPYSAVKPKAPLFAKVNNEHVDKNVNSGEKQVRFMIDGDVYQVYAIEMHSFSTDVYLTGVEGIDGLYFNSISFEFYNDNECKQPHNIYKDPHFNPYLREQTL